MPQKLTTSPEEKVRQYITDNIRPSEIEGYDPTQTDEQATDFLPITLNWDDFGNYYPFVYVSEDSAATLPGGGNTNTNGIQGNGSGKNQYAIHAITVSVQTMQGGGYLNGVDYYELAQAIYSEIKYQTRISDRIDAEVIFDGELTPPTPTREGSSTETWFQLQGTVPVGVQYTP